MIPRTCAGVCARRGCRTHIVALNRGLFRTEKATNAGKKYDKKRRYIVQLSHILIVGIGGLSNMHWLAQGVAQG